MGTFMLLIKWYKSVHNLQRSFDGQIAEFVSLGAGRSSEVERSLMLRWVVGSILHGVDPLSYFSFQPVLHDCSTKAVVCVILSVGWCI